MLLKRIEPNLVNYFTKYTKELKSFYSNFQKVICIHMFVITVFTYITKKWKQPTCLSMHAWINGVYKQGRKLWPQGSTLSWIKWNRTVTEWYCPILPSRAIARVVKVIETKSTVSAASSLEQGKMECYLMGIASV